MTNPGGTYDRPVPWLVDLASRQANTGPDAGTALYDDATQMSYLREPELVLAIASDTSVGTKKADRETGEDQKGF